MSDLTDLHNIYRILDLSSGACEQIRARCDRQFNYLYNQRQRLVGVREKVDKQRLAETAELRMLEEHLGVARSFENSMVALDEMCLPAPNSCLANA